MASLNDPLLQLEKLAEKQMKSVLHTKFLEECLSEEIVPKGLQLKLQVGVGNDPEDQELQASINKLLTKTSLHVLNLIREGHMRKTRVLANSIEEVRRKIKERMSDKQLFDMDTSIFKKTEEKKNIMSEKHRKKLTHLQQQRTGEKSRDISHSTHKNEQKKTGKTVSTVHISSDCTSVPLNTVKSKPKRANKRHTKKSKSKSNNQHVSPKTGPVTPDDDVIIVGTSTKTKHQTTKELEPKQRTSSQNKPAKNAIAPGTRKSYAEAIKNGAKSTTMQGLNKDSLHKTLQTVLTTVQQLMKTVQQNGEHGDSSDVAIEMHGKRPKRGQNKSQGVKRQF